MTRPDDLDAARLDMPSGEEVPDEVVRATLRSGDWAKIEMLIDVMWYDLPARFADEFIAVLEEASPDEIANRPRVVSTGMLAYQFRSGRSDLHLRSLEQLFIASTRKHAGRRRRTSEHPHDQLTVGLTSLAAARLYGDLQQARKIGDNVQARLDHSAQAALPWEPSFIAMRPGQLSCQRGLTLTLIGDFGGAMQLYQRAITEAGPAPYQHYAGVNAAANMAMLTAQQGHQPLALAWLGRHAEFGPVPAQVEHLTNLGAKIARAQLAIDQLDRAGAEAALREVGPASDSVELWPFAAAVHAAFDIAFDRAPAGLERIKATALAHNHRLDGSTIAGHMLLRAYLDLLVETGEGTMVLTLAERAGRPVVMKVPVTRTNLLAGRDSEVIRIASRALRRTTLNSRDTLELRLMLAVALLRLGRSEEAVDAFGAALRLGMPQDHPAVYARIPHAELSTLLETSGHADATSLPTTRDARHVQLVLLTPRELEVLRALAGGLTTRGIADRSSVSVNTVRTQVKHIYRKLDVSSRHEALIQADRHGLLNE
ncbi:hypothetical protein ASE14_02365 [Agromyces sp. Root81]|uniref:response regulator transcription factor n=1 Tax=Agromyces sp. Root81 TaxID=1736601 RepID=UPI0006F75BD7|nr:response regulator transcription factor [Agromyces sp. Root81]KRC62688.1 hypothetical protein ASE14_02365 [Agromyces sp. Root81]